MRKSIATLAALAVALPLMAGCSAVSEEAATQESNANVAALDAPLTTSLSITEVAAYQGLKATIAKNGSVIPASLPILANREALVRVYVEPTGRPAESVTAVLEVTDADGDVSSTFTDTKTLSAASVEGDLATTFNFTVPATALPLGAQYKVRLTSTSNDASSFASLAQFPRMGGRAPFGATAPAQKLKIVYVPIVYAFGGANFLPDTSPEQMERNRRTFMQLYPVADVEITMHAPYTFNSEIKPNGAGIGQLLREMLTLRANDGETGNVYYWGAFQSKATFQEYCSGGCVTGLSGLYGPDANVNGRASVGVGYTGGASAMTFAHELGHAHGRPHAPCGGAAGPDPAFPHADGSIGEWGYAPASQKLVDPATAKDFMSYCTPKWISGYNYNKLLQRLVYVNHAAETATPPGSFSVKLPYQFVEVSPEGTLSFGQQIKVAEAPTGEPRTVTFEDKNGKALGKGEAVFTPYDHIGGGYLLVPDDFDFASVNIDGMGRATR